jgi:hypothetical protein
MVDTLRNHHGIRHLNIPEKVADRFVYESLEGEDRLISALPGDDLTNHPGNVYASNPFMKHLSPTMVLRVRRMYIDGKFNHHPRLKKAAEQYLVAVGEGIASWVQQLDGSWTFNCRDSANGRPEG